MKYVIVWIVELFEIIETTFCPIINDSHLKKFRILIKKILKFRSKMTKDWNRKYFDANKYIFFRYETNTKRKIDVHEWMLKYWKIV